MYILGTNAAGILNKLESFEHLIATFKPGVFFVQESKTSRKNKVKLNEYVIFEHIRNKSGGGGLLTAIHKNLKPVSIGDDDEVVLTVQVTIMEQKVRFINGYGPQENSNEEVKANFFNKLDEQVKSAQMAGTFICIELDANNKLGQQLFQGTQNHNNGKLFTKIY